MHLIIILILLAVIIYLLTQKKPGTVTTEASKPAVAQSLSRADHIAVSFLADGKVYHRAAQGQLQQVHSPYVQEMQDKLERQRERNAWKEGTSFNVSAGGRHRSFDFAEAPIWTTSILAAEQNQLYHFMKDEVMGGLFKTDLQNGQELRIVHKQNLDLCDFNLHADSSKFLCAVRSANGQQHIAQINRDGSQLQVLTSGDTIESAPCAVSDAPHKILYHAQGIARNEQGFVVAYGSAAIQMLDLKNGSIDTVLDDPQFDFLQPQVAANGDLYFIRRPYEAPEYSNRNAVQDALYFPFRLLRAIFHYLNFFSMMYSRKPLTSAEGSAQADLKEIILQGKRIKATQALQQGNFAEAITSLVPASWQLIRRSRTGQETILAQHVSAYRLNADGQILYANGKAIFLLEQNGRTSLVLQTELVEDLSWC